jgi:hypothetical protein
MDALPTTWDDNAPPSPVSEAASVFHSDQELQVQQEQDTESVVDESVVAESIGVSESGQTTPTLKDKP